jgi:hypothetical protein
MAVDHLLNVQCTRCGQDHQVPTNLIQRPLTCSKCGSVLPLDENLAVGAGSIVPVATGTNPASVVSQQSLPTIAIIGTEGSGKTVFITTFAKHFDGTSSSEFFLNPLDDMTLRYVERNWQTLRSGEWPNSTVMGQVFNLHWRLESQGSHPVQSDLRVIDAAGQDLRRLFSDQGRTDEPLPDHLRALGEYCYAADIVICLLNLKDFLGEGDFERKLDNQVVITSVVRQLSSDPRRRLCLAFTQADRYQGTFQQRYSNDLKRAAHELLPYVHGAHLEKRAVILCQVAGVGRTMKVAEPNGRLRDMPGRDFKSLGFTGLMRWLAAEVNAITTLRQAEQRATDQRLQQQLAEENKKRKREQKSREALQSAFWSVIGGVIMSQIFHNSAVWICGIVVAIFQALRWVWLSSVPER